MRLGLQRVELGEPLLAVGQISSIIGAIGTVPPW